MNIGDVLLKLGVDDKGFEKEVVRSAGSAGDKAGKTMGQRMQSALNPKAIMAGFAGAFVASEALQFLDSAVNAAREEIAAINTMTQSIEANDAAWDGNIDKIEEVIDKRQELAFADDEQRVSLQRLVAITKDVNTALDLQRTAMDLARLRGMDLAAASDLVGKVYGGNLGILSRYGIQLEKGTTATEALAAIQEMAAGQAEAYAETELGASERLGIAIDNRVEDIGKKLLPIVNELTEFLIDEAIPALDKFISLMDVQNENSAEGIPLLDEIEDFLNSMADSPARGVWDLFGFNEHEIRTTADELGLTYEDVRRRVGDAMFALGLDVHAAVARIKQEEAVLAQGLAWEEYQNAIRGGAAGIEDAANDMAKGIPAAMEKAEEEGKEVARRTPGSLANELRAGIDDYDEAIDELAEVAANSVSDLAERQKIEGILASKELTDALNSDSTRTRLLAMDLVNDLVSDYELLAPGALGAGQLVNPNLKAGMESNLALATQGAASIVDAADNPLVELGGQAYTFGQNVVKEYARGLRAGKGILVDAAQEISQVLASEIAINSEPKSPTSNLRGITHWGGNMVRTIADDIYDHLGIGRAAGMAMSGAFAPGFAAAAMPGGAAGGAAGGPTFVLSVDGERRVVGSRGDVLDGWDQLGRFG